MPRTLRAILAGLLLAVGTLTRPTTAVAQVNEPLSVEPRATTTAAAAPARPIRRDGGSASFGYGAATSRPVGTTTTSVGIDVGRMLAALVIVLALIGLAYWAMRRLYGGTGASASTRVVKVLSRTPIAPRQQVLLLQVGRRVVVVGESAGVLTTLSQIDDADEVASLLGQLESEQMRRAASFGGVFGKSQRSFQEPDDANLDPHLLPTEADPADPTDPAAPGEVPPEIAEQKSELAGLLEKVRSLRGQIGK